MKWVTRKHVRVNRAATAWLIRRFIDPEAEFLFVEADEVAAVQAREGATGFDAPGATWPHRDAKGRCSFEAMSVQWAHSDHAVREMGKMIGSADFADRIGETAEGAGLRAICAGFPLVARNDQETIDRAAFLFDALHASITARMRSNPE